MHIHIYTYIYYLELDPPKPVLDLMDPKFDEPSPRSALSNREGLLADANGASALPVGVRSQSQNLLTGGTSWGDGEAWRPLLLRRYVPSPPKAAPVQNPGSPLLLSD